MNTNTAQFMRTINSGPLAIGALATWDGTVQTLVPIDPANPNIVVFHIIPRNSVGTQPLSCTYKIGNVILGTSVALVPGGSYTTFYPGSGTVIQQANNGALTVTPLAASAGASCYFDVFGYTFP